MGNQFKSNELIEQLAAAIAVDSEDKRSIKRKIYKRLKRLNTTSELASQETIYYVFNEDNYTQQRTKPITVEGFKFPSVAAACATYFNPDKNASLDLYTDSVRHKLNNMKDPSSEKIDSIFKTTTTQAPEGNSLAALAYANGVTYTAANKRYNLVKAHLPGITPSQYFAMSSNQINALFQTNQHT